MMKLKRMISMMVAAVVSVVTFGAMTASSASTIITKAYRIYNYETKSETGNYFLTINNDTPVATYNIIGDDERVPYTNSGIVYLDLNGAIGTGFIIGDHTIVTAAHCVYDWEKAKYVETVNVKLYNNNGNHVKTVAASEAHIPSKYKNATEAAKHMYDYALITVEEDLSSYEHFELGMVLDSVENSTTIPVSVAGFDGNTLLIDTGSFLNVHDTHVEYNMDVDGGESGGPVFVSSVYTTETSNGNIQSYAIKTAVAVHAYGSSTFNFGTRMTPPLLQFYLNNPNNTYEE